MLKFLISTMIIATSTTAYADAFLWAGGAGFINKEGTYWVEYPPYPETQLHNTFSEVSRADGFVTLLDPSRNFRLQLPLAGGPTKWQTGDGAWNQYKNVTYLTVMPKSTIVCWYDASYAYKGADNVGPNTQAYPVGIATKTGSGGDYYWAYGLVNQAGGACPKPNLPGH